MQAASKCMHLFVACMQAVIHQQRMLMNSSICMCVYVFAFSPKNQEKARETFERMQNLKRLALKHPVLSEAFSECMAYGLEVTACSEQHYEAAKCALPMGDTQLIACTCACIYVCMHMLSFHFTK